MRVLMVLHAPPCSPALGPARRHLHLFEEIARRHRVSIVTLGNRAEREQFEREHAGRYERAAFVTRRPRLLELLVGLWYFTTGRCVFRRLRYRPVQQAIDRAIAAGQFDAIYFSTVLLGYYRVPTGVHVVGDAHNVEHEVLARAAAIARNPLQKAYFRMQARATERDERQLARKFSEVWATSARDAERFAAVRGDRRVAVVPNGVRVDDGVGNLSASNSSPRFPTPSRRRAPQDGAGNPDVGPAADRFPTPPGPPGPPAAAPARAGRGGSPATLLFVGLMSYFPNADAVDYFLDAIFPLITDKLDARILVVGANPSRRLRSRAARSVEVVGRVPSVVPYFAQATAFVVPLRSGGGTRVKVLEAMMHGVPVVSTTMGCEGLAVHDGDSVLLADTPRAFADAVLRVCADRALAARLAVGGHDLVLARYDWRRIGDGIHHLLGGEAYA